MPLAKEPEIIPKPLTADLTPITPRPGQRPDGQFKNSVVDVRKRSVSTLLAYAEGSHWSVDYYRQLLTGDMEPTSFQIDQITPYQQYEKIHKYPVRVTDPLSTTQNEETLLFEINGSGLLVFAIKPNIGDIFYADIGDGRYGLFSIERINRKTILKDSVYEIDYTLVDYQNEENLEIIEKRTVRELYYSPDHLGSGRGPLITLSELNQYQTIQSFINELILYHSHKFVNRKNTILVRPEEIPVYDPYFSIFWNKVIPKDIFNLEDIPRVLIVGDEFKDYKTIWDCLLEKRDYIDDIQQGVRKDSSERKFVDIIYNGIALTDIKEVLIIDEDYERLPEVETEISLEKVRLLADIHPISDIGSYIFTSHFYVKDMENISKLEYLVLNYLNRKPLNIRIYIDLLLKVKEWDKLEQFYFIPILILLGTDYLRINS